MLPLSSVKSQGGHGTLQAFCTPLPLGCFIVCTAISKPWMISRGLCVSWPNFGRAHSSRGDRHLPLVDHELEGTALLGRANRCPIQKPHIKVNFHLSSDPNSGLFTLSDNDKCVAGSSCLATKPWPPPHTGMGFHAPRTQPATPRRTHSRSAVETNTVILAPPSLQVCRVMPRRHKNANSVVPSLLLADLSDEYPALVVSLQSLSPHLPTYLLGRLERVPRMQLSRLLQSERREVGRRSSTFHGMKSASLCRVWT